MRGTASELLKLAERCERATGPARELDATIAALTSGDQAARVVRPSEGSIFSHKPGWWSDGATESHLSLAYTASLDAAMTLVPEGSLHFARTVWGAVNGDKAEGFAGVSLYEYANGKRYWITEFQATAATPALALTAAALRAIHSTSTPGTGDNSDER